MARLRVMDEVRVEKTKHKVRGFSESCDTEEKPNPESGNQDRFSNSGVRLRREGY
jgi:hypothetical protein